MSFTKMVKILQEKNQDKIIICNLGNFYIAVGKDAIILNKIAKLRIGCTQVGTCKVGFPKTSLEKYTEIIKENDYSYIVYDFNRETNDIILRESYVGKNTVTIKNNNKGCSKCKNNTSHNEEKDIYLIAISKMYNLDIDELL